MLPMRWDVDAHGKGVEIDATGKRGLNRSALCRDSDLHPDITWYPTTKHLYRGTLPDFPRYDNYVLPRF